MLHLLLIGFVVYQGIFAAPSNNIETQTFARGGSIELSCVIPPAPNNDEVHVVTWFKNNVTVDRINLKQDGHSRIPEKERRVYHLLSDNLSVLKIRNLTDEDGGLYKCRVRYKSRAKKDVFIQLEIEVAPKDISSLPVSDFTTKSNIQKKNRDEDFEDFLNTESTTNDDDISLLQINGREEAENSSVCGPPPKLEGATTQIRGHEHAPGTTVSYQCELGYVPQGSGKFEAVCQKDGEMKWTNPDVVCVPRSCGDPSYVNFGRRLGNLFTFPNKVEFMCEEGYRLKGTRIRFCQPSGEWSGRLPVCERIFCPVPPNPDNGRVHFSSLEYGTMLHYNCEKGFVLRNYQDRHCNESGVWSKEQPACMEALCDIPKAPDFGTVTFSGDPKIGSLAFYSCEDGRELIGSSTSKCLETGQWTFETPKCQRFCTTPAVNDGDLGRIESRTNSFGTREHFVLFHAGEEIRSGHKVLLRCKRGFFAKGSPRNESSVEILCEDGNWDKSMTCKTLSCLKDAPSIENGRAVVDRNTHGHAIYYKCNNSRDYNKVPGHIECKYGEWVGYVPKCIAKKAPLTISSLSSPQNAESLISTTTTSSRRNSVQVTTKISPSLVATDANDDDCFCTYSIYSSNLMAYVKGVKLSFNSRIRRGDTATLSCFPSSMTLFWRSGLRILGSVNVTCDICKDWRAEDNIPMCQDASSWSPLIIVDSRVKLLHNGKIEVKEKDTVFITCSNKIMYPRWNVPPSNQVEILYPSRGWNDLMYKSVLKIVDISGTSLGSLDARTYECYTEDQYRRKVAATYVALQVSGVTCPEYSPNDNLEIIYTRANRIGSTAFFRCKDSSELVGPTTAECLGNGTWSNSFPTCKKVICPTISALDDMVEVSYSKERTVGSTATFRCKPPALLKGDSSTSCTRNGQWSDHVTPSCSYPSCSVENLMENLPENVIPNLENVTSNDLSHDYELQLLCEETLILTGNKKIKCSAGNWKFEDSKCESLCSLKIDISPELIVSPNKEYYRLGEFILLSCKPGYILTSEVERVMCFSGSWTDTIPGCNKI